MARGHFDNELDKLKSAVLVMGSEIEENLVLVADALISRNTAVAERLIAADLIINKQRIDVVMDSLALIAMQQPMARDMRLIASVIEIAGELERMHDYVKGIAKTSLEIGETGALLPSFNEDFPRMAAFASDMLSRSMTAFSENNAALARSIPKWDDHVDYLFNRLYVDIVEYATSAPDLIAHANQLEWTIHNMERAADRVINVCEWVVYMVTGDYQEFDSEYEAPPLIDRSGSGE